jgi:tetratricopeptide (TPR) repeat protein
MKPMCSVAIVTVLLTSGAFAPSLAASQHEQHAGAPPDDVGAAYVKFETSCTSGVRDDFNRAVALMHSFWFPQAIAAFEGVATRDPRCAMAHWGIALSRWGNPFAGLKSAAAVTNTRVAIDKARATGTPTDRERALIDAVALLTTDTAPGTHAARIQAYASAMAAASAAYPADLEARMFYALALNQTAPPSDKTYARQLQAAAILEPLFKDMPNHPGLAHYIIHSYDTPALADRALPAARRYASLAPAVPHALHMPSHTFTRVGLWKESVETNRKSAEAARRDNGVGEELHALDYQTYAYLQMAQDQAAKGVLDHALALVGGAEGSAAGAAGAGAFAIASIPARYALERGAWAEAAALPVRPANTPFTEAITHFARAVGAARLGRPSAALADITTLEALRDRLRSMGDLYWTEQVDIQRRVALAWVTFAQGRRDAALADLSAAADAEDATDKSAISPGPLAPARELYGFMLLEAGRYGEALTALEASMKKEPNRFRGPYGAARAAELGGDRDKAGTFYRRLLEIAADADTERPEILEARAYVGR